MNRILKFGNYVALQRIGYHTIRRGRFAARKTLIFAAETIRRREHFLKFTAGSIRRERKILAVEKIRREKFSPSQKFTPKKILMKKKLPLIANIMGS